MIIWCCLGVHVSICTMGTWHMHSHDRARVAETPHLASSLTWCIAACMVTRMKLRGEANSEATD